MFRAMVQNFSPARVAAGCLGAGLLVWSAGPVSAVVPEEHPHKNALNERRSAELYVQPSLEVQDLSLLQKSNIDHPASHFFAEHGGEWTMSIDTRSARPHLIQGSGLPILPGKGNEKSAEAFGLRGGELTVQSVAKHVYRHFSDAPDILGIDGLDLRLDPERSTAYGEGNYLWVLEFQQFHEGLRVEGAHAFFRINHGNLIQMGTNRLAEVRVNTIPIFTDGMALESALGELGHAEKNTKLFRDSELLIVPVALPREQPGFAYAGQAGQGYGHRLVWRFHYGARGPGGIDREYQLTVDAHSGEILENMDQLLFATVSGDIFPETNTDTPVNVNLPYVTVLNGTTKYTNSSGHYSYSTGTASTQLDGQYVAINDLCGSISVSSGAPGDLELGGLSGTDCNAPGSTGAGNTSAARNVFYHATKANRRAADFFPSGGVRLWLDDALPANTNIDQNCNAFWSIENENINFFSSGGGCSNTGELAEVVVHEWGHGMDQFAGQLSPDAGTREAVADTFAFLYGRDGCIGDNFRPGVPCTNCRSSCTGVRDIEAFAWGGESDLASPSTLPSIGCSCVGGAGGPMGYNGHCESYLATTANWDLTQILVDENGPSGWGDMEEIWYGSLTSAQSAYRVASGGQCNPSATVDGCGANNWYTLYLAVDDNDGNLMNGTPNACLIWDAFNTHGIACGERPICTSETVECLNSSPGLTAHWPLDEAIGVQATEVRSDLHGTYTSGTTSANGKVSRARYFDGINDHVTVPDNSQLDIGTGDFSLAVWIKTTDTSGAIVSKREWVNGKTVGYGLSIHDGRPRLQIGDVTNGGLFYTSLSMDPVNDGNWHHVAVTVDRNFTSGGRIYVDGNLVYTFDPTGRQASASNSSPLTIGRPSNGSNHFEGSVDEVQLYDRALPSSAITSLSGASNGVCRTEPLVASLQCVDLGHKIDCSASANQGTGGYTYDNWTASGGASILWSNGPDAEVDFSPCTSGTSTTISVTVTDSSAKTKTAHDTIECNDDPFGF